MQQGKFAIIKQTERGWPGHYILADRCIFHRNTLVEKGDVLIVVSTVGHRNDDEPIGIDYRRYETMAFHSNPEDTVYHDADVCRQIQLHGKWQICIKPGVDWPEDINNQANQMHEDAVKEIAARMWHGEFNATDTP